MGNEGICESARRPLAPKGIDVATARDEDFRRARQVRAG